MNMELTPETLDEFRERFGTLHDAVIHQVEYEIFVPKPLRKLRVIVGARDWKTPTKDNWINLTFEIEGVSNVIIKSSWNHSIAVIFETHIGFFDGEIFLDFFPASLDPSNPDKYMEISKERHVYLVVVGKKCLLHTSPYKTIINQQEQ